MTSELDEHLAMVVTAFRRGKVIPFLGAGASLTSRPAGIKFDAKAQNYLPNGEELAAWLVEQLSIPVADSDGLIRVAQAVTMYLGDGDLYEQLHTLFDVDYPPTPLHDLLARLPSVARERGWVPMQIVVTTNYDDLMERAFTAAGEAFDVFTYMALGKDEGRFLHTPPDGPPQVVERDTANSYDRLPLDEDGNLVRPSIVKLHGAVDRLRRDRDSYVIAEDHYIDFLSHFDLQALVPAPVLARLSVSNFLFLGYRLRDWNVRAILQRIWDSQLAGRTSWAIQTDPDPIDRRAWTRKDVDILQRPLAEYVAELTERLDTLPAKPA